MNLGTQGANETKTALSIRKDPDHPGSSFDLLIQPLQHIRALEGAMMGSGELQKGERFSDRLFHPRDKSGSGLLPAVDPPGKSFLGLRERVTVIEFAKLLQTGFFCRFRKVIQGVAKVMHITTLPLSIGMKITPFIGFEKYPPLVFKESLFLVRPNVGTRVLISAFP